MCEQSGVTVPSRSLTDWIVVDEGARLDYRYAADGVVFFSLGVHVFD